MYEPNNSLLDGDTQSPNFGDRSSYSQQQQQQLNQYDQNSSSSISSSSSSSSSYNQQQQQQTGDQYSNDSNNSNQNPEFISLDLVKHIHDFRHRNVRRYTVIIKGSAMEFHSKSSYPMSGMGCPHGFKYRGVPTRGATRIGDVTKAIVFSAKIVKATNNYPFPVMICSKQLNSNLYTNLPTQRGITTIDAGRSCKDFGFFKTDDRIYSKVLHSYSDINKSDFVAETINLPHSNEPYRSIDKDSKLGKIIYFNSTSNRSDGRYSLGTTPDFHVIEAPQIGKYFAPEDIYMKAVHTLQKDVVDQLPYTNLNEVKFYLERPGCKSWLSKDCISRFGSGQQEILSTRYYCMIEIEVEYRLSGHGM